MNTLSPLDRRKYSHFYLAARNILELAENFNKNMVGTAFSDTELTSSSIFGKNSRMGFSQICGIVLNLRVRSNSTIRLGHCGLCYLDKCGCFRSVSI